MGTRVTASSEGSVTNKFNTWADVQAETPAVVKLEAKIAKLEAKLAGQ